MYTKLKAKRKDSGLPDLYEYPIHKRLADYKKYSQEVLVALKNNFDLEISVDSLRKLQSSLDKEPTPFELKMINSYWSVGKGHYNRKISEIQVSSENPHLFKALELYNELRDYSGREEHRSLRNVSDMGYVSQRKNGVLNVFNAFGTAQMQCDGYDRGIKSYYYLTLNTIWSQNGIIASNRSIMNTIADGAVPLGAIYKEFNAGSYHNRLDFARYIDNLEIPCYECPPKTDISSDRPITKVSMLGYAEIKDINSSYSSKNDRIILIKSQYSKERDIKRFFSIASEGLNGFSSRIISCNDGIINALIDSTEGFEINMKDIPSVENSLEDFLLAPNNDYMIVFAKAKNIVHLKEILKNKGFETYPIGKITSNKRYVLLNEETELSSLNCDIVKYHVHDYSIFRIIDTCNESFIPLYKTFDEKNIGEYFKKNLALGYFYSNKIMSGVSSAKTISSPLIGEKQLTPMHVLPLKPSLELFDDECALMTSNVNHSIGNNDFTIMVNAVVSALMKLVVQGVPLCDTAISANLLYDVSGNRLVRGAALSKSLGCLYAQHNLSVGTMGNSIELKHNLNSSGVFADVTAIGTVLANKTISNLFKKGDKVYFFAIPRDEFGVPDFKYLLKFSSQINININVGNITSGRVIEYNIADAVIKATAGNKLGFSFAKVDEKTFKESSGDILLAVNDEWDVDSFNGTYLGVVDDSGIIRGADVEISQEEIERIISKYPFENNPYHRVPRIERRPQTVPSAISKRINPRALILHNDDTSEKVFAKLLDKTGFVVSSVRLPREGSISSNFALKLREQIVKTDLLICSGKSYFNSSHTAFYNALHNPVVLDALNQLLFSQDGLILGTGEGARVLLELGYLACGNAEMGKPKNVELKDNASKETSAKIPRIIIVNNHSPFLNNIDTNAKYLVAPAGEKLKFVATDDARRVLTCYGQIAMQFVDHLGYPTIIYPDNPYGSQRAVAGLSSPDGRILGVFAQPELVINVQGERALLEEMLISAREYFV